MRNVLNHVPPVFGCDTFEQVLANVGKSLKESFNHLENGLRKVADFHAHRKIGTLNTIRLSRRWSHSNKWLFVVGVTK